MLESRVIFDCLVGTCTSALAIFMLRRYAFMLGLLDHPDKRKQHIGDVPLVGGLAIFMGITVGASAYGHFHWFVKILIDTAMLLTLLGALDDRFDLKVRDRLLIQAIAILTVIASTGVYIHTLGHIFGYNVELGWLGPPLTVIAIIGLMNAFNLMDGIDGLAGSLELVSIASIVMFANPPALQEMALLLALLATASLPFLVTNLGFMGRKIFLGDAGSMLIGYLLAWALVRMSQTSQTHLSPVDVLWCVALPVLDTFAVMLRRIRQGKSPFKPDRGHIHHILMDAGMGPRATLLALTALAVSLAFVGAFISHVAKSAGLNLSTFCFTMLLYVVIVTRIRARQELNRRSERGVGNQEARMKAVLFANTDWYLYNFRRSLALSLHRAGYDVLLISPAGSYGRKLRDLGLRWEPLPMQRRSLNVFRELALLWYLVRLMRRERPAVVHGFTIKCAVYGSLAARMAGVSARVNAVAGMGYVFTSTQLKARLLRPVVRALLRLALGGKGARLVLQNADDVNLFKQAGLIDPEHIRLIRGSGVNCAQFADVSPRSPGSERTRVLLACRLLWDKGVDEYVAATRQLRKQGYAIDALIAGTPDPGNPASIPESTIEHWVDEGLITWLGHVDDMAGLLGSVHVVVLPSYREGLPRTLVEAAACGLPLITTDVPGCREVVSDGVDGLLVPVKDSEALAHAIKRIHSDHALARQLGDAARVKARAQFDERIVIRRTMDVYAELCHPLEQPAMISRSPSRRVSH